MWREALYCSVNIVNKLPTSNLKCTSYEMWKKITFETMQIFGSMAYVKILEPLKVPD